MFRRFIFFLGIQIASLCDHICSLQYIGTKKEKERVTLERSVIEQSGAGFLGVRCHNVFTSAKIHVAKTDDPNFIRATKSRIMEIPVWDQFCPKRKIYPNVKNKPECLSRVLPKSGMQIEGININIHMMNAQLNASQTCIQSIKVETMKDPILRELANTVMTGWLSDCSSCPSCLLPCWNFRDENRIQTRSSYPCHFNPTFCCKYMYHTREYRKFLG